MSYQRVQADPLTIAYIAMGAHAEIQKTFQQGMPDRLSDEYGGQLGFIGEVVSHALMLEQCLRDRGDDHDGVFVYDIAEPFGELYARSLFEGTGAEPEDIARSLFATGDAVQGGALAAA